MEIIEIVLELIVVALEILVEFDIGAALILFAIVFIIAGLFFLIGVV